MTRLVVTELLDMMQRNMTPQHIEQADAVERIKRAHKFLIAVPDEGCRGAHYEYALQLHSGNLLVLPFDECYFELHIDTDTVGGFLCWNVNGRIVARYYAIGIHGKYKYRGVAEPCLLDLVTGEIVSWDSGGGFSLIADKYPDVSFRTHLHANAPLIDKGEAVLICKGVLAILGLLHSRNNIDLETVAPSTLTNRIRRDKGKLPFFSHTVVSIKTNLSHHSHVCGSDGRLSPRLHWRRGHIRRLPSGKFIGIPPMLVGDKSLGIVSHDYEVTV